MRSTHAGGPPSAPLTAIVSPLAAELAAVRAATVVERAGSSTGGRLAFGRLGGAPVVLAVTGDGARAAADGLAALLAAVPVGRLLILGVAGGLSPDLDAGDLVASRRVVEDGREVATPDAGWLAVALAGGAIAGTMVTTERILVTPEEKHRAFAGLAPGPASHGARTEPATVDLETAAYARLAASRGIPFLAVRAVIDAADEALPVDFNRARRDRGGVEAGRVVRLALFRPRSWRALADLRRRLRRASAALASLALPLAGHGGATGFDIRHGIEDETSPARGRRAAGRVR